MCLNLMVCDGGRWCVFYDEDDDVERMKSRDDAMAMRSTNAAVNAHLTCNV